MSLLYVTSFSEDLYNETGHKLLTSYFEQNNKSKILICYEDFDFQEKLSKLDKINSEQIITYNLNESEYMRHWIETNLDIIPIELGGTAKKNDRRVYNSKGMNYRASQFFKKIASLEYAVREYGDKYEYIIWVDCDCIFMKHLPEDYVIKQFGDNGMFYHHGPKREAIGNGFETGFTGYQRKYNGYEMLNKIIRCFEDGSFRKFERWDDGFVTKKLVMDKDNKILCRNLTPNCKYSHVIKMDSPFRDYLEHHKGTHHRKISSCKSYR